jgi:hypothetical protein
LRPKREVQKSFIFPESDPIRAFQNVQAGGVRNIARRYKEGGQPQRIATVDQDVTIIESHKKAALSHYEGGAWVSADGGDMGRGRCAAGR